jgi:hypothetical protein
MAKVTKTEIEEYLELEQERKELERKARTIARRTSALAAHFTEEVEASGKTAITRSGYRLSLVDGRAYVSWKDEFVRECGALKADEILQAAPVKKKLDVQKAAA